MLTEEIFAYFPGSCLLASTGAIAGGCLSVVAQLVETSASVQACDRDGNTPFILTAEKGHHEIIDLLLEKGADPGQTNLLGSNALIMAVTHNCRKTARRLLALGLDVNAADSRSTTSLVAAYNGNQRMLNMLLEARADSNTMDATDKSAIVYPACHGYFEISDCNPSDHAHRHGRFCHYEEFQAPFHLNYS